MFSPTSSKTAALIIGMVALAAVSPASAAAGNRMQQDQYISDYCTTYPSADQCPDWRMNHGHWSSNQYRTFYTGHQNSIGFGGNVAAGLFGFAVGAMLSTAVGNNNDSDRAHVLACEDRYRSYDVNTDAYLGYDGIHHACLL